MIKTSHVALVQNKLPNLIKKSDSEHSRTGYIYKYYVYLDILYKVMYSLR